MDERLVKESSSNRSGEMFIQLAPDLLLDHPLQRCQHHPKLRIDLDGVAANDDRATDAGAGKLQGIALPLPIHAEFLAHPCGDLVDHGTSLGDRQLVRTADIYFRHDRLLT